MSNKADTIIINARVFTSDAGNPRAESVAIKGNRILFAGDGKETLAFKDENTKVIDAKGGTVTPGFIDSHFHLLSGAMDLSGAQLYDAKDFEQARDTLQTHASKNRTSNWVSGRGIKYGLIHTRQQMDEIISDQPVFITAYDGHTSWANTKALQMAGILTGGENPQNGEIVRDEKGVATGELREAAMEVVEGLIPLPDDARKRELLKQALKLINATGVTSVHNMNGDMKDLMTYAALEDVGEMTLRVYVPFLVMPDAKEDVIQEAVEMKKIQGEYVRGGSVKFFMDGVWESYTAMNLEPYADNPDVKPDGQFSHEHFSRMAAACDKQGLQIFVHCCGDAAVRRVLDGYESVQKENGRRDSRHRVEHIEVIHPDDLPRFKDLGVIASMQTSHAPLSSNEGDVWLERVGPQRWPLSFAWRDIKNAGAKLCLGSDWNVAAFDPLVNIHAALNRELWAEGNPDQCLTLEECILGYTRDAAYAEFMEHEKGQIKEGYLADLVIFSDDLFALDKSEILNAKVMTTFVDGKIVHAN